MIKPLNQYHNTRLVYRTRVVAWLLPLSIFLSSTVRTEELWSFDTSEQDLKRIADAALTSMAFTVLPDITTSSLSIDKAEQDDPGLSQFTFGGGFTLSEDVPLYLEGSVGYSRFDPVFIVTKGEEEREIPVKWNSFAVTGGIGWDFPINQSEELMLRPIMNFTLGYVATDAYIGQALLNSEFDLDLDIVDGGQMNAYGLGGSLMLDYERYREEHEIDVELRYTFIQLRSFGSTTTGLEGESETNSLGLWARWRAPTGLTFLQRPLRYLLETSYTSYFGPQRGALGFNHLTSLGAGFEIDSSAYPVIISRTRLVGRYFIGENVRGYSVGLSVSF